MAGDTGCLQAQQETTSSFQGLQVQVGRIFGILNEAYPHFERLKSLRGLDELRSYLAPQVLYHTGKRGGPNYNRPRQLLDDIEDLVAANVNRS